MCDPKAEAIRVYNKVGGQSLENSFPPEFIQNFPPSRVQSHHCLRCLRDLSSQEMFPGGRMPRYMCEDCYNRIVYSGPHSNCLTCGGPLPYHQVQSQAQNPRELKHAFHQGVCWDYHVALAGIVFGIPFKTNEVPMLPNYGNNTDSLRKGLFYRPKESDVIDVTRSKPNRIVKRLKLLE